MGGGCQAPSHPPLSPKTFLYLLDAGNTSPQAVAQPQSISLACRTSKVQTKASNCQLGASINAPFTVSLWLGFQEVRPLPEIREDHSHKSPCLFPKKRQPNTKAYRCPRTPASQLIPAASRWFLAALVRRRGSSHLSGTGGGEKQRFI